jgi:hypothetical protein
MAWGAGTSIAHRAIDAIMGPRVIKHETVDSSQTVAASATAAAPAPNTNKIGISDVCVGQSKALTDVWFSSYHFSMYYYYYYFLMASVFERFGFK